MARQRTLEEALAGIPARPIHKNRDPARSVNPRTGKRVAPPQKRPVQDHETRKAMGRGSWFARIKPDHPEYDPELARKHFLMTQANGRKGAEKRRSVPKGFRWSEWQPIWAERLEQAKRIVAKMEEKDLLALPEEEFEKEAARAALAFNVTVFTSPEFNVRDRLAASSKVLEYTKQKPAAKVENKISAAEDFLAALVGEVED